MVHQPVLEREITTALSGLTGGVILDCTLGGGGHSAALLDATPPSVSVVGIDRDPDAVEHCRARFDAHTDRFRAVHASFGDAPVIDAAIGSRLVIGILMDLGLSSFQIDAAGRGFSFSDPASLDMRFDPTSSEMTAREFIQKAGFQELADVIYRYGEEPRSRRIARAIIEARETGPITSGAQLGDIIRSAVRSRDPRIHPATRTFQALRIATNHELDILERTIDWAIPRLAPAGRIAIISFHSLEDRIVKNRFARFSGRCQCPPDFPVCRCEPCALIRVLTRKPIVPSADEILKNPRARSAKLRIAQKLEAVDAA